MNSIAKNLGINIKKLRKSKHYSQEVLAEKIGVNVRQIARIEAGKSFMSAETIYNICIALNVQPYDLFNFKLNEIITENNKTINKEQIIDKLLNEAYKTLKNDSNIKKITKKIFKENEEII